MEVIEINASPASPVWIKILLLALVVVGTVAAVLNTRVRPLVLWALAGLVMVAVLLRFYEANSSQDGATQHRVHVVAQGSDGQPFVSVEAHPTPARGVSLLLTMGFLALVFLFFFRRRRAQAGWGWIAPLGAVLVLLVGWVGIRTQSHAPPTATLALAPGEIMIAPDAVVPPEFQNLPGTPIWQVAPEEPLDELWERLNASRIHLGHGHVEESTHEWPATAQSPASAVATAAAKVEGETHAAATMVAETAADAEPADHAHEPEPTAEDRASPGDDGTPLAPKTRIALAPDAVATPNKPRPEWVGQPPKMVDRIYRVPIQAGPYATLKECYEQLRQEMRSVVVGRIQDLVRESTGAPHAHVPDLEWMQIGNSYIDRELRRDEPYVETTDTSVGEMQTAWVLLEFTENNDRELVEAWKRYARSDGIAVAAVTSMSVVGVLGMVLLLLKVDTWTRGYYTKRLFLGVPATIMAAYLLMALVFG